VIYLMGCKNWLLLDYILAYVKHNSGHCPVTYWFVY